MDERTHETNYNYPKKKRNVSSILKAIASFFVWGLGQLFNRQYLKALLFFIVMGGFISIELFTSNYFKEIDPYDKLVAGSQDFSIRDGQENTFIESFIKYDYILERIEYEYNGKEVPESLLRFDEFANIDLQARTFDIDEERLIEFIALDLQAENPTMYKNISDSEDVLHNVDDYYDLRVFLAVKEVLYRDQDQVFYRERNYKNLDGDDVKDYIEVNFMTGAENEENIVTSVGGYSKYEKTGVSYLINNELYIQTAVDFVDDPIYINITDVEEVPLFELPTGSVKVVHQGPLYIINENIYEYIMPGLIYGAARRQYEPTAFTKIFTKAMHYYYNNKVSASDYVADDYTRFLVKVHLALNPDQKESFETGFNNFFYDKAGFFVRSYWGVFTLGSTKKVDFSGHNALFNALTRHGSQPVVPSSKGRILELVTVQGHVSTHILLEGLIGIILSMFFFIFMIWSVVDAYRTSEKRIHGEEVPGGIKYFKEVYESSFEYIVLSPALFVLSFISIMPILFGFLLAFTSISGKQSMSDTFNYVGFRNFFSLFNFADGFGASFGRAFWRVLWWTIIWAILSTATVFFGGLFQALILNSDRVQFKKFWRTILILPWAMPALLSQMVFSVMFGETGFINNMFRRVGFYDLFSRLGWLGQDYSLLRGAEKFFYIGKENIQWFTNPFNPTFVRLILIIVNIWLGFPYFMALMSGIMTSIDKSLYEAADIDGATKWQKLKFITMPLILYSTAPILIMTFSGNFNNFGVIYFITGGGPNAGSYSRGFAGDTDILISWMYKLTVDESIYNIASVFSVLIFIFVGSVTAWNLSRTRAFKED